jgi:hypothetical protein
VACRCRSRRSERRSTSDAERRQRLIANHLDRLEAELDRTRTAVGELRDLLERPDGAAKVKRRSVPAMEVVAISETVGREDVLPWWPGALGELHATVRARDLRAAGPSGGLFEGDLFEREAGAATVFIPVTSGGAAAVREVGRGRRLTGARSSVDDDRLAAERDPVAGLDPAALDPLAVDRRPVGRFQVLQHPGAVAVVQPGVTP